MQITLNIKDNRKLNFFLELIKNLDFVEVENTLKVGYENNIAETFTQVNQIKPGKIKTESFDEFISEL